MRQNASPSSGGARHRILLVDDDAISLEILAAMLGCDGHEVLRASDGESALRVAGGGAPADSPDVLLVDMRMPGLSGCELARRVRALGDRKPLLLAMSATSAGENQLEAFDGFVLKPPEIGELRRALSRPSGARRPTRANRRPVPEPAEPSAASEPEVIDGHVLDKLRRAMSASSLEGLYAACLDDSRARIEALRRKAESGNLEGMAHGAHQIKGAAAMTGATRLAAAAAKLECQGCQEEDTLRLLGDLLRECDALERMLLAGKIVEDK